MPAHHDTPDRQPRLHLLTPSFIYVVQFPKSHLKSCCIDQSIRLVGSMFMSSAGCDADIKQTHVQAESKPFQLRTPGVAPHSAASKPEDAVNGLKLDG